MRCGWIHSERFLKHDTGRGHPERSDRLRAITEHLNQAGLNGKLTALPFEALDRTGALTNHNATYLDRLHDACERGARYIDVADSAICAASEEIAYLAAGGGIAAVEAVMSGKVDRAFCAIRPPGHHCERDRSMGFCLLNNVAIAARHLRQGRHLERVLILDWDVHHGNGTQHTFEDDPSVFFCSLHEHPNYCYPGTGFANETGKGAGRGTTMNLPMMPHSKDEDYKEAFRTQFEPAARAFKPEFILVSAGFDAHQADPLATIDLTEEAFAWMTERVTAMADELCEGRLVSFLEGGYDLDALGRSVSVHVSGLL
jgi:acetoin utilization deacetylase AcuC-like enzyme